MSDDDNKEVTLSLRVMINKERDKVLFAVADNHFADILLSFLTLPLGRIMKVLEKHYGDEAPTVGSLRSLYRSLANLDSAYFWTDGAKQTLLKLSSSFDAEYAKLKVDISDSPPFEYFNCFHKPASCNYSFRSLSLYYDTASCLLCSVPMKKIRKEESAKKGDEASDGVLLTMRKATFIISDDLQIFPNEMGMLQIIDILGISDIHKVEEIQVALGFNEIMKLLKASLSSPTPLSDVILSNTRLLKYSATHLEREPMIVKEENPKSRTLSLKLMIRKSTGRLLYAEAKEDFVEFLFSLLIIPLGGVKHLAGKTCCKAIDNLYMTTFELIDEYFMDRATKNRLTRPNLPHGFITENHILPLTEEGLTSPYNYFIHLFSSANFPKGQGRYLLGPRTYHVTDDLTVTPFCIVSILSSLSNLNVPLSDVKEVELEIGLKEALSLLRASLTSTSAITDGLLNHMSNTEI